MSQPKRIEKIKQFLIVAAVLVVLAVMVATGFAKIESLWFVFPLSGIRISTLISDNRRDIEARVCIADISRGKNKPK